MGPERAEAIEKQVKELLEAGFIREVRYSEWVSNVVMVKKANGKWRKCTDYTLKTHNKKDMMHALNVSVVDLYPSSPARVSRWPNKPTKPTPPAHTNNITHTRKV